MKQSVQATDAVSQNGAILSARHACPFITGLMATEPAIAISSIQLPALSASHSYAG